jgi:hypothetical protein
LDEAGSTPPTPRLRPSTDSARDLEAIWGIGEWHGSAAPVEAAGSKSGMACSGSEVAQAGRVDCTPGEVPACAVVTVSHARLARLPPSCVSFAKAFLSTLSPGDLQVRTLPFPAFTSSAAEAEFSKWHAIQAAPLDLLFSALVFVFLLVIGFTQPYCLWSHNPTGLVFGAGALSPALLAALRRPAYLQWREWVVAGQRLYLSAFILLVSIPSFQARLPAQALRRWLCFWVLSGAESMIVTGTGLQLRMALHLPLQVAMLALAIAKAPAMCEVCYPGTEVCVPRAVVSAVLGGLLVPTAISWAMERRARALFVRQAGEASGLGERGAAAGG